MSETNTVSPVEEAANTPIIDIITDLLNAEERDLNDSLAEVSDAVQRLIELAAGITGDPKNYDSKKACAEDFSEYRALILAVRRLLARLREDVLPGKQAMLDSIEAGNKPSMDKLQAKANDLLLRIAKMKQAKGEELNAVEEALLASAE